MSVKTETKVGAFILASVAIFAYCTMHLGLFRFASKNYTHYYMSFEDLGGLVKKADVKIAGVKVGWVDDIKLVDSKAKIKVVVKKNYKLYEDALGEIRQEGLVGSKYLELSPGSNAYPIAQEKSTFIRDGKSIASLESVINRFETIAQNIEEVSSALKESIGKKEQISGLINDISQASSKFNSAMDQVGSLIGKVNNGDGLVGKLINEPDIYNDLKVVSCGFRKAAEVVDNVEIFFDNHFESMYKPAEHYEYADAKGYLDMRFRTSEDTFYMFQVVGTQKGTITRNVNILDRTYINPLTGMPFTRNEIEALPSSFYILPSERIENVILTRNQTKFGIQIGKTFTNMAARFGIFENSVGAALDYQIPFENNKFRWVTSFEAFDFRGQARLNDTRPHLKWINRLYLFDNIYLAFGADDFISRHNANAFIGGGVRFTDDDLKYLIGKLGVFSSIPLANN